MIGKTFSYDRKNCLIRQFFFSYRKVLGFLNGLKIRRVLRCFGPVFCLPMLHLDFWLWMCRYVKSRIRLTLTQHCFKKTEKVCPF
ncbi:hypothetical protein GCWU000325_02523 [Alloprevotella tannerae ATCC 51259]|uniref:Uncharacterized protein n=1 Tax=Alloprevotella tannerae ATCC 51259 TaxID=626522 RepID=C9LJV9_9BACT|nr:hypothetical protein GCWU000325_02523 [Alloprevotella tannerae ATCC 51259]